MLSVSASIIKLSAFELTPSPRRRTDIFRFRVCCFFFFLLVLFFIFLIIHSYVNDGKLETFSEMIEHIYGINVDQLFLLELRT